MTIRSAPTSDQGRRVVQRGLWFEGFDVGVVYEHRPGRTLTETDNVLFTTLTMNMQPLHLDAAASAMLPPFHERLVNSMLTLSTPGWALGLSTHTRHARCEPRPLGDRVSGADENRGYRVRRDAGAGQASVRVPPGRGRVWLRWRAPLATSGVRWSRPPRDDETRRSSSSWPWLWIISLSPAPMRDSACPRSGVKPQVSARGRCTHSRGLTQGSLATFGREPGRPRPGNRIKKPSTIRREPHSVVFTRSSLCKPRSRSACWSGR